MREVVSSNVRAKGIVGNYFAVLRRWFWLLGLCMLLGGAGAYTASKLATPTYRATTLLVVGQQTAGSDQYTSLLASTQLIPTYLTLITQPVVLQHAADQVGGVSAQQLVAKVSVKNQAGTQIIELDVDDAHPDRAAQLANTIAATFIEMRQQNMADSLTREQQQLDQQLAKASSDVRTLTATVNALRAKDPNSPQLQGLEQRLSAAQSNQSALQKESDLLATDAIKRTNTISIFQPATPPVDPDHPKPLLNAAIGGVLGLVIAAVLVWLLEFFDRRIRTVNRAKALLRLPVVGVVGTYPRRALLLGASPNRTLAKDVQALLANLELAYLAGLPRTIAVTSATSGEGRTTTAVNLAIALARKGRRVLLVDGDLHQPFQSHMLAAESPQHTRKNNSHVDIRELLGASADLPSQFGLSLVLSTQDHDTLDVPSVPGVPGLYILPAGPNLPDASELFRFGRIRNFLQWQLDDPSGGKFDFIVLDTPAADIYPDAALSARWFDATILVVDARNSHEEAVLHVKDMLLHAHAKITGIVLNRAPAQKYSVGFVETQDTTPAGELSEVRDGRKLYAYYNGSVDANTVREGGDRNARGPSKPDTTPIAPKE